MTNAKPSLVGAITSDRGVSIPDLWRIMHSNTDLLCRRAQADTSKGDGSMLKMIVEAELELKKDLLTVSAQSWEAVCAAAGWTLTGAAALSWCKDATIGMVWGGWHQAQPEPKDSDAFIRAANLVKKDLLPSGLALSNILEETNNNYNAACAALIARKGAIRVDFSREQLRFAPEALRAFLSSPKLDLLPTQHYESQEG